MKKVLIIDDEPDILELLTISLSRMGLEVVRADSVSSALQQIELNHLDLCLTDMKLPDGNGMSIIQYVQMNYPDLPIAMITAHGDVDSAVEALKSGAFDFLNKPLDLGRLRQLVTTALKLEAKTPEQNQQGGSSPLLGETVVMQALRQQIEKLARSQAPVHINGESGTGKEMVARLIHQQGPRAGGPFVPVNCGAVPPDLMESEFFGHKKGSFTGATDNKQGLFEAANGGTLFLDEIADLPLAMQVKLLRAIQEKRIRPIGASQEIDVDVRLLSATHKDLRRAVDEGDFRNDLFYRLNVIELRVPALRERRADIALLARHILQKIARDYQSPLTNLSEDALSTLLEHDFPGNVRELENILERAAMLCEAQRIESDDLGLENSLDCNSAPSADNTAAASLNSSLTDDLKDIDINAINSLDAYLESVERQVILKTLENVRWNKTAAAKKLGMSFRSMRYRLEKLGIE